VYRIPRLVVSSISHPSQPVSIPIAAPAPSAERSSDSRAAIGELGGGDSRAVIGELEVLAGAARANSTRSTPMFGAGGDKCDSDRVLADAGRAARSDTAMKACEHDLIAEKRK